MNLNNITTRMHWQNEDDDEQENKDEKNEQLGAMMMKKLDTLFFQKRTIYLWGVVNDSCWMPTNPAKKLSSISIVRVE